MIIMQRLAKNLAVMSLVGIAIFIADLSTVSCHVHEDQHAGIIVERDDKQGSDFWDKFRESVKPREENPREKPPPKEKHPTESPPKEIHPEEADD